MDFSDNSTDRNEPFDADQARISFLLTVESTLGMLASRQSRGVAYGASPCGYRHSAHYPGSSCASDCDDG